MTGGHRTKYIGQKQYRDWLGAVDEDGEPKFSRDPIYAYRGKEDVLFNDLWEIAAGRLTYPESAVRELAALQSFGEVAGFFASKPCMISSLDYALLFLRRALAHVLAYSEQEGECVVATKRTVEIGDSFVDVIDNSVIAHPATQFTWYVTHKDDASTMVYIIEFTTAIARDPTLWYKRIVSHMSNPVSVEYRAREQDPSLLNIAAPFLHAEAYANKTQDELDELAASAWENEDVRFVLNHFMELMAPPEDADRETKDLYREDGWYLFYTVAWCIQHCRRSAQIITLLTPVQQCGKTTVLSLLQALLGYKIVVSMSAEQLDTPFLDILRGRLFVFFDEGIDALMKYMNILKRITGCSTLSTQEKFRKMVELACDLTAWITGNQMMCEVPPGNVRIQPHFLIGHLHKNPLYFARLYLLLSNPSIMRDAFLAISRVSLTERAGNEFRPSEPSRLCAQHLTEMADARRCAVYARLTAVLGRCGAGRMSATEFDNELSRAVALEGFRDARGEELAVSITRDLVRRHIILSHPEQTTLAVHMPIPTGEVPAQWEMIYAYIAAEKRVSMSAAVKELARLAGVVPGVVSGAISSMIAAQYLTSTTEKAYITTCLRIRAGVSFSEPTLKRRCVVQGS